MAPQKKPLLERIERLSHQEGGHLVWDGRLRDGYPHLKDVGNPVRVLLKLNSSHFRASRKCPNPRCIDPHHYKVVQSKPRKFDDEEIPLWIDPRIDLSAFTEREQRDIMQWLELLTSGEAQVQDLEDDEELSESAKAKILSLI